MNDDICFLVTVVKGTASIHLVKYLATIRMNLCPLEDEGLIFPTKSRPHYENGHDPFIGYNSCAGAWIRFPWI